MSKILFQKLLTKLFRCVNIVKCKIVWKKTTLRNLILHYAFCILRLISGCGGTADALVSGSSVERRVGSNPVIRTKMKRQTSMVCFFVLVADEDAEPTSRGCYSTKRYLKLNFKNTTRTQVTEASRIGFTKLAEPYLGYPLNISYSNQNSLGGDDNIPSFKSDGANGLRSTRI